MKRAERRGTASQRLLSLINWLAFSIDRENSGKYEVIITCYTQGKAESTFYILFIINCLANEMNQLANEHGCKSTTIDKFSDR